ncbi:ABC transporter ATP-binding protein [SCandidatus Aminicenantes bacterium Aminicenantia_JdfR_composite]|jgi:ABC-2 type transport system ATP-binding protein|nr:ABC transporter ATP-binding protein [SCandidatus Aminicenantes bacterium Aminicenantia_JdfR_composite]MCP2596292.1 ABC transporter ATP-binding protein [Candidatus Aminicenantes bacterium AC-335-G13]MCP2597867.1 ABC transporter ATP-binding protein [Candidatus Aminicenantes bacterium AC-335-L06]MCP2620476.1 ABC transporter ATP-binding protein [Candidatus Aminicenantes bacterium AC-334-E05]
MNALEIRELYKSFKTGFIPRKKEILKGISLSVKKGNIYGYLGPNGAGKTTTIKTILGLIFPDKGEIKIFGKNHLDIKAKQKIGFLPENPYFYDYLTAYEFLNFYARLSNSNRKDNSKKINDLLNLVGLSAHSNLQLRKFSRGMLQRIGIAQALISDPELVILDEPLSGLDPIGRKEIRDVILRLRNEGKTIFFSSHILQDIEMICDQVGIIINGKIISEGRLEDLISEEILYTEVTVSGVAEKELRNFGETVISKGGKILLKIYKQEKIDDIIAFIVSKKGKIHSLIPRTYTLEDIFLGAVKRK